MIMFKACPRCRTGDVVAEGDDYGRRMDCLQCGYSRDVAEPVRALRSAGRAQESRKHLASRVA